MLFGTYRTLLALAVILHHLGGFWELGRYAVFGFFILSGFLMNYILHESYGYTVDGLRKYALNRFLRIFPTYWFFALISLILTILFTTQYTNFHPLHGIPGNVSNVFSNLFLIVFRDTTPRLIPQSWALTVELIWYALIGLGISKTKKLTLLWFSLSLLYTAIVNALRLDWDWKYFHFLSASLPFSTGAMIFHYRDHISRFSCRYGPIKLSLFFCFLGIANYVIYRSGFSVPFFRREVFFYANYALQALTVASLATSQVDNMSINKWDKEIGKLSYPMYLAHYIVAAPIFFVFGEAFAKGSPLIFYASIIPILLVSLLAVLLVDNPIEQIRKKIKQTNA